MTRHHAHDGHTYSLTDETVPTTTRTRWALAFGIALVSGLVGAAGAALATAIYPGNGGEFAIELRHVAERFDE